MADDDFWRQRYEHQTPADIDRMRMESGRVMCPDCHAAIDADCVNTTTGQPLRNLPCHPKRLTYARKAADDRRP
jgi:hypothetical protein